MGQVGDAMCVGNGGSRFVTAIELVVTHSNISQCDEVRPHCSNCVRRRQQDQCVYRAAFDMTVRDHKRTSIDSWGSPGGGTDSSSGDEGLIRCGEWLVHLVPCMI
jgi:hypothetical protein